jgi:hypothetical protein
MQDAGGREKPLAWIVSAERGHEDSREVFVTLVSLGGERVLDVTWGGWASAMADQFPRRFRQKRK